MCGLGRGDGGSGPLPQSAGAQGRLCRKADSLPNFSPGSWGRGNRRAQPQRGRGAARAPPGAAGRGSAEPHPRLCGRASCPALPSGPGGSAPGEGKRQRTRAGEGRRERQAARGAGEEEGGRGPGPLQHRASGQRPAGRAGSGRAGRPRRGGAARGAPVTFPGRGRAGGGQRRGARGPAGSMWRLELRRRLKGTARRARHTEALPASRLRLGVTRRAGPRRLGGRPRGRGGGGAARRAPAGGVAAPLQNPRPGPRPGVPGRSPPSQCA